MATYGPEYWSKIPMADTAPWRGTACFRGHAEHIHIPWAWGTAYDHPCRACDRPAAREYGAGSYLCDCCAQEWWERGPPIEYRSDMPTLFAQFIDVQRTLLFEPEASDA